jgi:hypothetical protein
VDSLYNIFQNAGWESQENNIEYHDNINEQQLNQILHANAGKYRNSTSSAKAYVRNKAIVENLIIMRQKTIGLIAAGWKSALNQLGSSVGATSGKATVTQLGISTSEVQSISIVNNSAGNGEHLSPESRAAIEAVKAEIKMLALSGMTKAAQQSIHKRSL